MSEEVNKPFLPQWLRVVLIGRRPRFTLLRIVVLVVVVFIVFGLFLLPVRIGGPSMLPTYRTGGINLVNRLAYLRHGPARFDVITIRVSGSEYSARELWQDLLHFQVDFSRLYRPSVMYMKRVVGLPGETISFSKGRLLVNGTPIAEPYLRFSCYWNRPPQKLGPTQYFVVGDNRAMRMEDHTFGATESSRIVGKVLL